MHRLLSEFGGEPERDQVQITVYEAVQSEFGRPVLAGLVFHHFFTDLAESRDLGKVRNLEVHIVIDFYVLDYDVLVSLQSAVEIVQVRNAGEFACRSVEQFCRYGL